MATLIKRNARKLLDSGKILPYYGNINYPGLLERKHITLPLGDHLIRVGFHEAEQMATDILKQIAEFRDIS